MRLPLQGSLVPVIRLTLRLGVWCRASGILYETLGLHRDGVSMSDRRNSKYCGRRTSRSGLSVLRTTAVCANSTNVRVTIKG